mmetsp:Transcript_52078/g.151611  ORF Transcript_52078/g.151611 Transcript_52078/m.151611 type:complete len:352 (+) Transcript_52078:547-1602(+)
MAFCRPWQCTAASRLPRRRWASEIPARPGAPNRPLANSPRARRAVGNRTRTRTGKATTGRCRRGQCTCCRTCTTARGQSRCAAHRRIYARCFPQAQPSPGPSDQGRPRAWPARAGRRRRGAGEQRRWRRCAPCAGAPSAAWLKAEGCSTPRAPCLPVSSAPPRIFGGASPSRPLVRGTSGGSVSPSRVFAKGPFWPSWRLPSTAPQPFSTHAASHDRRTRRTTASRRCGPDAGPRIAPARGALARPAATRTPAAPSGPLETTSAAAFSRRVVVWGWRAPPIAGPTSRPSPSRGGGGRCGGARCAPDCAAPSRFSPGSAAARRPLPCGRSAASATPRPVGTASSTTTRIRCR